MTMSRPFAWLMILLLLMLALGVWLLVLGIHSSPFSTPFVSSI